MKINILLLASNPKNTSRLRLSEEFRDIRESIKLSNNQHDFNVFEGHAVRAKDLRRLILEKSPHIIHYSGHGESEGILLEDEQGNIHSIEGSVLEELFGLFSSINCVVLNSCYSASQANTLKKVVPYIIGMTNSIKDQSAIDFSIGFYDAIASKRTIEDSFKFGLNAISLHNNQKNLYRTLELNNIDTPKIDIPILIKGDVERSLHSLKTNKKIKNELQRRNKFFIYLLPLVFFSLFFFYFDNKKIDNAKFIGTTEALVNARKLPKIGLEIILNINGDLVTGDYKNDSGDRGIIKGKINGNSLDLNFVSFKFSEDCILKGTINSNRTKFEAIYNCPDGEQGKISLLREK